MCADEQEMKQSRTETKRCFADFISMTNAHGIPLPITLLVQSWYVDANSTRTHTHCTVNDTIISMYRHTCTSSHFLHNTKKVMSMQALIVQCYFLSGHEIFNTWCSEKKIQLNQSTVNSFRLIMLENYSRGLHIEKVSLPTTLSSGGTQTHNRCKTPPCVA